jgi:sugar lactone lactonase YvrE
MGLLPAESVLMKRVSAIALAALLLTGQTPRGNPPTEVSLIPANESSLSGDQGGFSLSKCGSDKVSVVGVDRDGNYLLGPDAWTPNLVSDSSLLTVMPPQPAAPNLFTIRRSPANPPKAGVTVHLIASVTPLPNTGEDPVEGSPIAMTFNSDICGVFTEFAIPSGARAGPQGIVAGPDGNLWFTEMNGNKIAMATTSGTIREFSDSISASSQPRDIIEGPDHNLWFTESAAGRIGKITTAGVIREYPIGSSEPYNIAAGSDDNIWFTQTDGKVGTITTAGKVANTYALKTAAGQARGIAPGPDGSLWVTECANNKIAVVSTDGDVTEYAVPTAASCPSGIVAGPDDNLWFTENAGDKIGRITTAGAVTEYPLPARGRGALGIVAGGDGNLWFAEYSGHAIGEITTEGVVTEFSAGLNEANEPSDVAAGPDGSIWFTDGGTGKIGRLQ